MLKTSVFDEMLDEKSCYVIGTNIAASELSSRDVIASYKNQNTSIENGAFRFLKDPIFFVSSLFLKKPSRIMGLLMVMTLSLLVYAIAQRRLRAALKSKNQTIPNQIKKPIQNPTSRWAFQIMDGIFVLSTTIDGIRTSVVNGLTELQAKIVRLIGGAALAIYGIGKSPLLEGG